MRNRPETAPILRRAIPGAFFSLVLALHPAVAQVTEISVMTYNILTGGQALGQPLSKTVEVIRASGADIVGLQEQSGSTAAIARALDFHYRVQNGDISFVSRYPITEVFPSGARIELGAGQDVLLFNVHLAAYPYGPYDLRDNRSLTEAQLVATARATRGAAMSGVLATMAPHLESGTPVFLVGDFNEPSHLDWTQETADAGLHFGRNVNWPTSNLVHDSGLVDSYREVFPDPVAWIGETWTPLVSANEVHDRIDILYHAGDDIQVLSAAIVGEREEKADIVVTPYPSDHRAVVATYSLGPGDFYWVGEAGAWNRPENWNRGEPPGAADNVRIDNGGTPQIDDTHRGESRARAKNLVVGERRSGGLAVDGGTLEVAGEIVVGSRADSVGTLELRGDGRLTSGDRILIGDDGAGTLRLSGPGATILVGSDLVIGTGEFSGASQWGFQRGDLSATAGGGSMAFFTEEQRADTNFGTADSFGIPDIGGAVTHVLHFPAGATPGHTYRVHHRTPSNGGGVYTNRYTMGWDIYIPSALSSTGWIGLYNTNASNSNVVELYINPDGAIGVDGQYSGEVSADAWHRVVVAVDLTLGGGNMRKYVDGAFVGSQNAGGVDGRFSLYNTTDGDPYDYFTVLGDNGGFHDQGFLSNFFFVDRSLTSAEVAALGGPSAEGISPDFFTASAKENGTLHLLLAEDGTATISAKEDIELEFGELRVEIGNGYEPRWNNGVVGVSAPYLRLQADADEDGGGSGEIDGEFSKMSLPPLPGDLEWVSRYSRARMELHVSRPGDDDLDGVLDDPQEAFDRGDANADDQFDITDGIFVLNFLFIGGGQPPCLDAADADDSGELDITDGVTIFNHLFLGGRAPGEPFGECGGDPSEDGLSCDAFEGCREAP